MLNGWALHLDNCSSSGSLTYLQIMGSIHVLTIQTNLYKLQLFYLFILKVLHLFFMVNYNINICNSYLSVLLCTSFPLCYHLYVPSSTFYGWPSLLSNLCLLYFYLHRIYECWLHSCPVRWGLCFSESLTWVRVYIRWADTWSWLVLDNIFIK